MLLLKQLQLLKNVFTGKRLLLADRADAVQGRLPTSVPPVWIPAEVVEECADEVLHAVTGRVVQRRVVVVVIAVAVARVQYPPQFGRALVHLKIDLWRVLLNEESIWVSE